MTPSDRIRTLRASTGLTQAEFAARFGIPKRSIENWEGGKSDPPPYLIALLQFAVENGFTDEK